MVKTLSQIVPFRDTLYGFLNKYLEAQTKTEADLVKASSSSETNDQRKTKRMYKGAARGGGPQNVFMRKSKRCGSHAHHVKEGKPPVRPDKKATRRNPRSRRVVHRRNNTHNNNHTIKDNNNNNNNNNNNGSSCSSSINSSGGNNNNNKDNNHIGDMEGTESKESCDQDDSATTEKHGEMEIEEGRESGADHKRTISSTPPVVSAQDGATKKVRGRNDADSLSTTTLLALIDQELAEERTRNLVPYIGRASYAELFDVERAERKQRPLKHILRSHPDILRG